MMHQHFFFYILFHWWQPVMGFQAQWGLQALGAAGWEKQPTNLLTLKSRALPLIMLKVKFAIASRWSRQQSEWCKNHNPRHWVLRLCYKPSLSWTKAGAPIWNCSVCLTGVWWKIILPRLRENKEVIQAGCKPQRTHCFVCWNMHKDCTKISW